MRQETAVLARLQSVVGEEAGHTDEFEIEKGMIRRFAQAIGDPSPLYSDEEFARKTKYGGIIAPFTMLFEWNHHRHSALSIEKRHAIFEGLEREPRSLRGVTEYEVFQPLRPGDVIKSQSHVAEVYQKQGRSGPLVFAVCENSYFNQRGEALGRSRETFIFLP